MSKPAPAPRKLKAKERETFLAGLAAGWSITHAAKLAGRERRRFYDLRGRDEAFAVAWDEAIESGTEALEDEARRRAVDGWEENVYQQGELAGTVRRYSDGLLTFLLKGRRPEKYRDTAAVQLGVNVRELHIAPDPDQATRVLEKLRDYGVLTHVPRELTAGEGEES
jgi:hypothetical protein